MSYRLIVDENLDPATAEPLRARGHDATTVDEEFGKGEKDPNILAYARETNTLVLTNDTDFLDRDAIGDVKVIFCPRTSLRPGEIAALVDALASYVPDQDNLSQITHLREDDLL
jgi:predicted nuclease of predicted toxin-antitoxin system